MRGIDWDKVQRNRKVWKPHYRENFHDDREPSSFQLSSSPKKSTEKVIPPGRFRFAHGSMSAHAIKQRLTVFGMKGRQLTKTTNEILTGKKILSHVECDLHVKWLFINGFQPVMQSPIADDGSTMVLRFVKRNKAGDIEEEASITFKKQ